MGSGLSGRACPCPCGRLAEALRGGRSSPSARTGWLEMRDKVGPGPSGQSGVGSARTSGVDGSDWMRRGAGLSWVTAQRDNVSDSVSRIEIQQDGTIARVDPEQVVELAGPLDVEAGLISVDS
ncbi:hypothetical protein NDU88_011834 [Pleurodeles waltl]|uniref:Uncharacterized protein n=1 Tax=Pleurodeles waltl TaxID=8319 RepID=A0AAV7R484_PLEWA|nr:hypothetical protein NDU88_011834 [Pleurodeles waltl]